MKCPICEKQNLKSNVYPCVGMTTVMYCSPYYNEEGIYHSHASLNEIAMESGKDEYHKLRIVEGHHLISEAQVGEGGFVQLFPHLLEALNAKPGLMISFYRTEDGSFRVGVGPKPPYTHYEANYIKRDTPEWVSF